MAHTPEPHPPLQEESYMDYEQHERTYEGFLGAVKYSIISLAILAVGLYFAVIAGQPLLGLVLVLASIVAPVIMAVMARK